MMDIFRKVFTRQDKEKKESRRHVVCAEEECVTNVLFSVCSKWIVLHYRQRCDKQLLLVYSLGSQTENVGEAIWFIQRFLWNCDILLKTCGTHVAYNYNETLEISWDALYTPAHRDRKMQYIICLRFCDTVQTQVTKGLISGTII
ncbi:uncharacterized protein LOC143241117 [Tachypleus tridentatus]|uniref:uncharacterized protein LOC143241117 n=1 Tax=Tachypleus tridentatus TaxID=6853 RepID=UPI003FD0177D